MSEIDELRRELHRLRRAFDYQSRVFADYVTAAGMPIPNDTSTIVDFLTKVQDTHNAVTVGANWRFTAPFTNVYNVSGHVMLATSASWDVGDALYVHLVKNGVNHRGLLYDDQRTDGLARALTPINVLLNAGDYIDVRIHQVSGGALSLQPDLMWNWISIASLWEFVPGSIVG